MILSFGRAALLLYLAWVPATEPGPAGLRPAGGPPPVSAGRSVLSQEAREVEIRLNGRPLGRGRLVARGDPGEAVYLRVADLTLAVDGPSPAAKAHLRLRGSFLYALALGGCEGCAVRVNRSVVISSRVREIEGQTHLPLGDLVRAFEGRLEVETAGKVYGIYAGACSWCILAPNDR